MRVLLDTHTLIWWICDNARLSRRAASVLKDSENEILVSAVVGWEIAIKVKLGKIAPAALVDRLQKEIRREGFFELPIAFDHAVQAGSLPLHHRDPFDRVLVAQALSLDEPILSADQILDRYGVRRIW